MAPPFYSLLPFKIQEADCTGLSLNNSCEADSLSCYYINSLNRTDAVHLLEYQVLQEKGSPLKVKFILFHPHKVKQIAKNYLGCRRHEKRPELGQTSRRTDHSQTIYQQLSSTSALEGIFRSAVLVNKVQENGKDRNMRPEIKPR